MVHNTFTGLNIFGDNMTVFFSADQHFGHQKIIEYCNRPYKNVDIMDNALISNWNSVVSSNDIVFVVGDFAFHGDMGYAKRLNGTMVLIKGNHDRTSKSFDSLSVVSSGKHLFLNHLPYFDKLPETTDIIICGHVHHNWLSNTHFCIPMVNVGVDVWGYKPVDIESVIKESNKIMRSV
jgi:calcineurin-like phosphoesterase family protein